MLGTNERIKRKIRRDELQNPFALALICVNSWLSAHKKIQIMFWMMNKRKLLIFYGWNELFSTDLSIGKTQKAHIELTNSSLSSHRTNTHPNRRYINLKTQKWFLNVMQLTNLCRCNYSIHSVDWFWIEYCARLNDLNVQMSRSRKKNDE